MKNLSLYHKFLVFRAMVALLFCFPSLSQAQKYPAPYRSGQLWGYANPETGQIIVPPTLDSVGIFSNNEGPSPITWVKKGNLYGLYNHLGELVLPIIERVPLPIAKIAGSFFSMERLAFSAENWEQERVLDTVSQDFVFRPVAFLDSNGRVVGVPFAYETYCDLVGEGGGWSDPNGFNFEYHSFYWQDSPIQEIWKDGKVGLFDLKKAEIIVPPIWNSLYVQGDIAIAQLWQHQVANDAMSMNLIDLSTGMSTLISDSIEIVFEPGAGDLVLAKYKSTGLFGFLNKQGVEAIPFKYKYGHPFSGNGLTKVLLTNDEWSIIDLSGNEVEKLGKYNGFIQMPDGSIWKQSNIDRLFRKKNATDVIGLFGFDYPPQEIQCGNRFFWKGSRAGRTGMLDMNGNIMIPFEMDDFFNFTSDDKELSQDSMVSKHFLSVIKNGSSWLFNAQTLQPLWPKINPDSGLKLGKTFDKSNFQLLRPIAGDSLFVIKLTNNSKDILNAHTGKRWGIGGAIDFNIISQGNAGESFISYYPRSGVYEPQNLRLNGQIAPIIARGDIVSLPDFQRWTSQYDVSTGLTAIIDSTGRQLGRFRIPFEGSRNRILIQRNNDGNLIPFVVIVHSERGESAVFSLDGRLLSPPYIWEARVSHDLIFATMYEKQGVYRLSDGHEILPCAYSWITWVSGNLSALALDGTLHLFAINGKLLGTYPKGYGSSESFSNGLQVVYHQCNSTYVNEKLEIVFKSDSILQARSFSEGLGAVQVATLGWKYIRPNGKQAIAGFFEDAQSFQGGRAIVRTIDGWTKLIDNHGNAIMQVRSNISVLSRLRSKYILQQDSLQERYFSLDGKPVLNNFVYCTAYRLNEPILFFADDKWGVMLSDGTLKPIDIADFTIENNWITNGDRYVLKGFECAVEGVRNNITGAWIIAPKFNQSIYYDDGYAPFGIVMQRDSQNLTLINRNTGEIIHLEPGYLQKISDQIGWLLIDNTSQKAILYSPDLKTKKPWNYARRNIQWNEELSLYQVNDEANNLIGYIAKNGRLLFEN